MAIISRVLTGANGTLRITIPAEIRHHLNLQSGDYLLWAPLDNETYNVMTVLDHIKRLERTPQRQRRSRQFRSGS